MSDESQFAPYSATVRFFHWASALLVLVMVASGLVMVYRGKDLNIWDQLTNTLYTTHKTLGLVVLALIVMRVVYRVFYGAPPDEPGLSTPQRVISQVVHWSLYALLLALPILGWIGISLFPALGTFGGFQIPALMPPDQTAAKQVLWLHGLVAYLVMVLIGMHIAAALYHHTIRRDNVLRRMWPRLRPRAHQ